MASVSVSDCFQVLVNVISALIKLNLTIFDLTQNWVIHTCTILKTAAIGDILVILHVIWSYFEDINSILSNFYGFDILIGMNCDEYNSYWFQSTIISCMKKCQYMILILTYNKSLMNLVWLCYFLYILTWLKRKSQGCTTMTSRGYDYDFGIIFNLARKNLNCIIDKFNFLDELFDINDYIFHYLCMINEVELDKMDKIQKARNVDDIIDEMSIIVAKYLRMISILSKQIFIVCINISIYLHVSLSKDKIRGN